MKKYLLGLLAVPIMSPLLSIASANCDSVSAVGVFDGYNPGTFTTDGGVVSNLNLACAEPHCFLKIIDSNNTDTYVYGISTNGDYSDFVDGVELSAGTYILDNDGDSPYDSVSFNVGVCSSSSDSVFPEISVPSSFTSGLTQLVENFGGTVANWIPSVLLIALGITAIFALFRVVRGYAKSAFKG